MPVNLADNELLRGFQPGWVGWLRDYGIAIDFDAGAYVIEGGAAAAGMYLLLSGTVSVLNRGGETISRIEAGGVVGEMALIDGGARSADVVAETPLSTLLITRERLDAIGRERRISV
ncbi:MAG: cyclic nucleotide-binding domain-containing protein [Rhizobiales bacterium]|nr:cyclic nucleotide-binding domain-containing protein [Hyphomicrobiales bacterium]